MPKRKSPAPPPLAATPELLTNELKHAVQERFRAFMATMPLNARITLLHHNDADGLSAGVILVRALTAQGHAVHHRTVGKGENAWSAAMRDEMHDVPADALVVADLGSRETPIKAGVPTLIIDHHRPLGSPPGAVMISGYGVEPTPTSGLLAFWCAQTLADASPLLWIAAVSILGDLGDRAPFAELTAAKAQFKTVDLREVTSLVNAPRRSASGDATPAWQLLSRSDSPRALLDTPEADQLQAARDEVTAAMDEAKRAAPKFSGQVAIIRTDTPCQVHPMVAQIWRNRLPKYIVLGMNAGYRPGFVHFSARTASGVNLLDFFKAHAPEGADESYGGGHDQASGGALPNDVWNRFAAELGFGEEMQVKTVQAEEETTHV